MSNSLRQYRHARALSQHELAALAGIRQDTVSRIELGRARPRCGTRHALAEALGVPVDLIFPPSPEGAVSEALRFLRQHAPEQLTHAA